MLIRCPECGFERNLNPTQIPDSAIMATCPQCEQRFRFRDHVVSVPASGPLSGAVTGHDDPLPPGAITPPLPGKHPSTEQGKPHAAASEREAQRSTPAPETSRQAERKSAPDEQDPQAFENERFQSVDDEASSRGKQDNRSIFSGSGASSIPWEVAEIAEMPLALYHTVLRVLFAAQAFFMAVGASRASLLRPFIFYVVIGLFQNMAQRFWFLSSLTKQVEVLQDAQAQAVVDTLAQSMSIPMLLVTVPPLVLVQLMFFGGLFYLMLRLVQPQAVDFATVLRVIAYSGAPGIFAAVPVVGGYVAGAWFAVCCFLGLKYALNMSWERTALAVLPLYGLALVVSLQMSKLVTAALMGS